MTTSPIGKSAHSIICSACGAANAPGSRFCERCGTRLSQPGRGEQPTTMITPGQRAITGEPPAQPALQAQQSGAAEQRAAAPQDSTSSMPPDAARDTPTQALELPAEGSSLDDTIVSTSAAAVTPAMAPIPIPDTPPAAEQPTQSDPGWNYRSWTPPSEQGPPPREATSPPPPPAPEGVVTPPASAMPGATDPPTMASPPASGRIPSPVAGRYDAPITAPLGYPAGGGASNAAPLGQGMPTHTTQPAPGGYMRNAGTYPLPPAGNNNKTLWIILGVIGGLFLICVLLCVLVIIVAAASAAGTSGVATSVATATRR